jgi:hypothetical protein
MYRQSGVSYTRHYGTLNFSICDERHAFPIQLKLVTIFQKSYKIMILGLNKGDSLTKSSPLLPEKYISI